MDLSTTYLGLRLKNPLVPSASPLSESLETLKRMEDAGASAIVLFSLFEEQIEANELDLHHHLTQGTESYAEALSYFPDPPSFYLGPEAYLTHIAQAKSSLSIPIIASLNGSTPGGWTSYAQQIQEAGADALELNIYYVPTDLETPGSAIEQNYLEILRQVKASVTIPVAVKLSPFFSNLAHMARQLDQAGANGLVLFNQFYQPDIDLERLEIEPHPLLSVPHAMRLPLCWVGLLHGRIQADLAATSGIHDHRDVLKLLMAGAKITMLCSTLYQHGIEHLSVIERRLREWLEKHEYESVKQLQGSMSQANCPSPSAYVRAQYIRSVHP